MIASLFCCQVGSSFSFSLFSLFSIKLTASINRFINAVDNRLCEPLRLEMTPNRTSIVIKRLQRLVVPLSFTFTCKYSIYELKWTLSKNLSNIDSVNIDLNDNPSTEWTQLIVPGNKLDYGHYTATYNITVYEWLPTATVTFLIGHFQIKVIPSDLKVNLIESGAHTLKIGITLQISLNPGLYTLDPDMLAPIQSLRFKFYCVPDGSRSVRNYIYTSNEIGKMDLIEMKKLNLSNFTVDLPNNLKCFTSQSEPFFRKSFSKSKFAFYFCFSRVKS
jgi:hypothetical protein